GEFGGCNARSARPSGSARCSLDDVLLDRLDGDAVLTEPGDGGIDLVLNPVELEGDDADLLADARTPHVESEVELLAHLVDERFLHEGLDTSGRTSRASPPRVARAPSVPERASSDPTGELLPAEPQVRRQVAIAEVGEEDDD